MFGGWLSQLRTDFMLRGQLMVIFKLSINLIDNQSQIIIFSVRQNRIGMSMLFYRFLKYSVWKSASMRIIQIFDLSICVTVQKIITLLSLLSPLPKTIKFSVPIQAGFSLKKSFRINY